MDSGSAVDFLFGTTEGLTIVTVIIGLVALLLFFSSGGTKKETRPTEPESSDAKPSVPETKAKKPKTTEKPLKEEKHANPLLLVTLRGHTDAVTSCSFSPDGEQFVTTSKDRTMRLYKPQTFSLDKTPAFLRINLPTEFAVKSTFSADSSHIVLALDSSLEVLAYRLLPKKDAEGRTYKEVMRFPTKHTFEIKSVHIASNNKFIVTCDEGTVIKLWTLKGVQLETINTVQIRNNMVACSLDSKFISAATWGSEVKVWEVKYKKDTGEFDKISKAFDLKEHKKTVFCVCFSSDTKRMATTSKDGTWKLWNIDVQYQHQEDAKVLLSVPTPNPKIQFNLIAISPDQRIVAVTADQESSLYLYSAADGTLLHQIDEAHNGPIVGIAFAPNSQSIATCGDSATKLWRVPKGNAK